MSLEQLAIGGRGTVVLCLPPGAAAGDPDPTSTRERGVALLATTADNVQDLEAALEALAIRSVAVAGSGAGGLIALELAARRPELVSRLALIATPAPESAGASLAFEPSTVRAKTLLVYGGAGPNAASAHGRSWQRNLPDARLEMTPDAQDLLRERWARVMSHLAPRAPGVPR